MQNSLEICFKSKQKFSFTILKDCQWKIVWKVFKSLFFFENWTCIRYFTFLVPDSFICRLATVPSSSSICPLEQLASTLLPCHDRWKKRKIFIQSFVLLMIIKGFQLKWFNFFFLIYFFFQFKNCEFLYQFWILANSLWFLGISKRFFFVTWICWPWLCNSNVHH